MWNIRERRKLTGNSTPTRTNLAEYLRLNPQWAVYTGQDKEMKEAAAKAGVGGGSGGGAANSSVSHLWCRDTSPGRNDCSPQGCVVDNSTVFYIKTGEPLPAEAQEIVDGSGARAGGL